MSTQLVKQSVKMVVQNGGKQPTKVVHFLVDPAHQSQVIHIEAKVRKLCLKIGRFCNLTLPFEVYRSKQSNGITDKNV